MDAKIVGLLTPSNTLKLDDINIAFKLLGLMKVFLSLFFT